MYKWEIVFMFNNGKVIEGIHESKETNSGEVLKEILGNGAKERTFFGLTDKAHKHNIVVCLENVDVIDISEYT